MNPFSMPLEAAFAQNTTDKVYQRGVDYFEQGAVLGVVRRGTLLQAEVEGSEDEPYLVTVILREGRIQTADCTCPYGEEWDGWCKHIVAVLLFCRENGGDVEERPALGTLLAGLDRDRLQSLVEGLAAADPRLVGEIEEWLADQK